ncbi:MAG: PD-(D/E)XK nuclease family protein [Bacteroidaceae bacterium]|nr:PD-(D/E)XK nuclease family protein [Bacteroidaceae bacterium]
MKSFLNIIASDMLSHFSNDMRDVTVVFPGKRAGMFLSREFALLSDKPVWTPSYCTMGDLFLSLTPIQVADPLECICHLHSVMQEVLGTEYTETLDDFWSWGEVLMADFDDIDKHLANAKAIFTNIADQERLKNLDYLDDNQRKTLERFFGRFSLKNSTRLQEKFLHTWSHMYEIYTKLHERLLNEGKLWEGALLRHVTEQMQADDSLVQKLLEGNRAIVFAGFNVLNNVEHNMMSLIQREGKARFYWDYDIYYCDPKKEEFEAGFFMKQNLRDFPNAISGTEAFDNFRHLKDVTFIACTSDNAAARYVNSWALPQRGSGEGAVVLCNEALMQPVLHAIPEEAKEVNVTMGFPVADTPIYGIIMSLLKLQIEGYDADRKRFRYPFVQTLRRQPLFELLNEEDCFTYCGDSTKKLLDWLLTLVRQIAMHYAQIEEPNIFEQLYSETIFRIDRMLCLLKDLISNPYSLILNPLTLRRLLRQMMISTKIPFHSEPDRGLQVMGMLETRCLDFEHMLLLSVEEGNLPRSTRANSFIPESLREAFGMTTQRHRIAVYAYYFYRLVQRCEHLTCVYNESTSEGVQHEMSRFLRQMLAETDIPIRTLWLRSEPEVKAQVPIEVKKTPEVMERLRHRYDQSLKEGEHIMLSPSAINTYMACPMKFYINNVLRIRREDDPEEGISADIIGTIFHDTAEFFYEWLQERYGTDTITADMLCEKGFAIREAINRELQKMLHVAFDVCWFHPTEDFDRLPVMQERFKTSMVNAQWSMVNKYKGTTLISHDVLLRYLQELIRFDARNAPFRIIGTEEERTLTFQLSIVNCQLSITVGGRIDRIDETDGHLRIVDYKTGSYKLKDKVKMENVIGMDKEHVPYYLQTFLYALAEMEEQGARGKGQGNGGLPIKPILFFPIKAASPDYDPSLKIDGEIVDDFANQHAATFREGLQNILEDIFNPDKPFTCTSDAKVCEYCKLGLICGKGNQHRH